LKRTLKGHGQWAAIFRAWWEDSGNPDIRHILLAHKKRLRFILKTTVSWYFHPASHFQFQCLAPLHQMRGGVECIKTPFVHHNLKLHRQGAQGSKKLGVMARRTVAPWLRCSQRSRFWDVPHNQSLNAPTMSFAGAHSETW
jgi:hypothetical protein